jgi:hypothetical protein
MTVATNAELVPASQETPANEMAVVIERLAANPEVDVVKLEKVIDLQERILAYQAKAEFDAAFSVMQGELPVITERGEIEVNGVVRSKFARYEDIIEVVRPILAKYGFGLRHKNGRTPDGQLQIVGILSHRAGHREDDSFDCLPDSSGGKNAIQANGSTRSYGQRYTTISLLNIVTRGSDNDGATAEKPEPPSQPPGVQKLWDALEDAAPEGFKSLDAVWGKGSADAKTYIVKHKAAAWKALRAKATAVKG